jgi:hypothetical protein
MSKIRGEKVMFGSPDWPPTPGSNSFMFMVLFIGPRCAQINKIYDVSQICQMRVARQCTSGMTAVELMTIFWII